MEEGFSEKSTCTFINDATRAWNKAPTTIKNCKSLFSAKKAIKSYVMTLPTLSLAIKATLFYTKSL